MLQKFVKFGIILMSTNSRRATAHTRVPARWGRLCVLWLGRYTVDMPHSILTRADYEDYLVYLYFGSAPDLLTRCLNRAYLDFNRTLHGMGIVDSHEALFAAARGSRQGVRSIQGCGHRGSGRLQRLARRDV